MASELAAMGGPPAQPVSGGIIPFAKSVAQSALSAMTPRTPDQLVDSFNRSPMGQATAGLIPDALKERAARIPQTPGQLRSQTDAIYNSPANVAERQRLAERQKAVERRFDGIQDRYQKMADRQLYDTSDPKNMAMAVAPRENVGIDEGMVAASGQRARDRFARATQPAGLPDLPVSDPDRPLNAPRGSAYYNPDSDENRKPARMLGDMTRGEESRQGGVSVFNPLTRVTRDFADGSKQNVVAGNTVDYSQGTGRMTIGPEGSERMVILPASGNSIGLRTVALDENQQPISGTITTQSDEARRKARQDLAIIKGNEPGATAEEKLAGQQAQEAQDKYAAYKARRDKRRSDALDIRQAANAMRGYGQVGEQFMGFDALGNRMVQPIYGQTGPSLAQAAGMVRQQRAAQERMDKAMKEQRERQEQQARQDMILEAYKSNPNDPRLADAFSQQLGLRDRTPEEQSRYDRDQFNLKIGQMTQNNELTMDPRQVPGAGVGDLDKTTRSKLAAGIDDALKSDLLTDEDRDLLFRNVDLDVMKELIDGTAWDDKYWDGERSEKLYKDFEDYLKRTDQFEEQAPPKLETPPSLRRPVAGPLI